MLNVVFIVPNTKIFENEACVPNTLNWRPAVIVREFRLTLELLKLLPFSRNAGTDPTAVKLLIATKEGEQPNPQYYPT